jgi:hypothetical protein
MVAERATIPILKHDKGPRHVYVDAGADLGMAADIAFNAKAQRPGVCNAMETLLVHADAAAAFLPAVAARLRAASVELRGCPRTLELLPEARPATDADWDTEYLDLVLSVRVVPSLDEAIAQCPPHGSGVGGGHRDAGSRRRAPLRGGGRLRLRARQRLDAPRRRQSVSGWERSWASPRRSSTRAVRSASRSSPRPSSW